MSGTPTPAPPRDEFPPEQILLSRPAAWILTSLFLMLLAVPPLLDGLPGRVRELVSAVSGMGSRQPIAERLRGYDSKVASAAFTGVPRQLTQQALTSLLGKGNDRVLIGRDGWLFYRPEIQALTGYGPIQPEPHSVSRDPALLDWEAPLEPIRQFAAQLRERGVALWLVPAPMKPAIYPEMLSGAVTGAPVRHRDAAAFFASLTEAGIRVMDPAAVLFAAKAGDASEGPVYLKDDTHWSTRGMLVTTGFLASQIRQLPALTECFDPAPRPWTMTLTASAPGNGDLVEKLGLRYPERWSPPRMETLAVVSPPAGIVSQVDRGSPMVVLGDSFVNIFDDPGLGFPRTDGRAPSQAGFAWQLAHQLGMPLDVHAVNGEGASGVRRWLAQRGESVVRSKKLVLWVIAERDLFLSRSAAKANGISWERVHFAADPPGPPAPPAGATPGDPVVVEAMAMEKADQADPRQANYENALYTVRYEVRKVLSGQAPAGPFEVVHWHFKKRVLQPASSIEPGHTYRLQLEPWGTRPELETLNLSQIGEALPVWWAEGAEPLP